MPDIDKELAKELQQAKKKGRNFAIIAKSANVVKLLLSKKPIRDGEILSAKKESGGNIVVQGVASGGDGPELVFRIREETKVGAVKLRAFITDNSGLTLKVRFEVQPDLQELDLGDDDASGETTSGEEQQSGAPKTTPVEPTAPKTGPSGDETADLEKRLRELVQLAKETNAPQLLTELKPKFSEAQLLGRKSDFRGAQQILDGIEKRIADFKSGKTGSEEQERPPSPGVQDALDAVAQSKVTHRAGFRIACDKWNKARDVARVQMEKFAKAVIDDNDLKSLPVYDQIAANAAESVVLLERFDDSLSKMVEQVESEDQLESDRAVDDAKALIDAYQSHLDNELLFKLMDNGAYGKFQVYDLLSKTLAQVASKLNG